MLLAFEQAETAADSEERRRPLTFVLIGGGPTGVEMAGAIAELAKTELAMELSHLHATRARIVLIEAGPQLLPAFPASLAEKARRSLERLGVEVCVGSPVENCDADGITTAGRRIAARTLVWTAGVEASDAARWLDIEPDRGGRVPVGPDLSLPDDRTVFVIGDTALVVGGDGKPVPGIAPAAKQEGAYVARLADPPSHRNAVTGPVPLLPRGEPGNDRAQLRDSGLWLASSARHARLADLGRNPHFLSDRLSQPHDRRARLALVLFHLRARRTADHRKRR